MTRVARANRFKRMLAEGRPAFAMWVSTPWMPMVEILGEAGCDAVLIDMEHTPLTFQDVEALSIAATAAGITPFYRPPGLDAYSVSRALDAGVQGIVFPRVKTPDEAARAVALTRLPPLGDRPWPGPHSRDAMFDGVPLTDQRDASQRGVYSTEYVETLNREVYVTIMIEDPEGVANVDKILDVDGVDALRVGFGDYSASVGFRVDETERAAGIVYEACRSRGKGYLASIGELSKRPFFKGCSYLVGYDTLLVAGALRSAVARAREAVGAPAIGRESRAAAT